jgi:hypothetical protein
MRRLTALLGLLASLTLTSPAFAEDEFDPGYGTRFLQTSTPLVNTPGVLEAVFQHRFNQPVNEGGGNNLGGLDSGANIGLGVNFVPTKNLAFEIYRSSNLGDYEFSAKWTARKPTKSLPIAIGLRAGANWLTKTELDKKAGVFGQLLVAATLGERFTIGIAPSFVSNTPAYTDVWNVPLIVQAKVGRSWYATGEYVFRNQDLKGSVGQWSFAVEKSVFMHRFSVWIGNSGALTVDQSLAGDYGGGVKESNVRLGFNIIRQFEIFSTP